MEETIKDIRKRCRMAMNGIASASMRNHGLNYKLNFGVSIQKIKDIASRYEPNKSLAESLWLDTTRELKILGTLLYPVSSFDESLANIWVTQIPNQEIREQVCLNLFQQLTYADTVATSWVNDDSEDIRTTGYWLLSRRMLTKTIKSDINLDALPFIWDDITSQNVTLRNSANLFLKNTGRLSEKKGNVILEKVRPFKDSDNLLKKEIYDSLAFEFGFYHTKE